MTQKIVERIHNKLNIPNLVELLVNRLSFGELQSLLLKTIELKTRKKDLTAIFTEYQSSRFTQPSDVSPVVHRKLELAVFSLLPEEFQVTDLSPLAPIGTTSILTTVHQNNIVSTIRNLEVAADTTNVLALECARRRSEQIKKNRKSTTLVKLCSSQRLTRAQPVENENFSAHFNVIGLCTAGRDEGNENFEEANLVEHIRFYIDLLDKLVDQDEIKRIHIKVYEYGEVNNRPLIERVQKSIVSGERVCFKIENNSKFGRNYYTRLRFMISVVTQREQEFDYIDGGFTNWTARLLNNQKERLLTSGIGTDFLLRTVKLQKV